MQEEEEEQVQGRIAVDGPPTLLPSLSIINED